ncbi:vacuolar protein sorting-associated protein 16B [Hetaerina americana]|uniref:vacuolar protein sorting-associated protein 16B n=1 Tax=Hetaerina americana TaxID=62018 RepID=UPI003A7F12A0
MASFEDDEAYWNETKSRRFNFDDEDENSGSRLLGVSQAGTSRLSRQIRSVISNDAADTSLLLSESSLLSESTFSNDSNKLFSANTSLASATLTDGLLPSSAVSDSTIQRIINADMSKELKPRGKLLPEEELKILRRKDQMRWQPPPVEETLRRILLGLPFSLECYRSLDDKIKILDAALDQGNGDAILCVVQFLSRTLKRAQFTHLLSHRPVAVSHYAAHLSTRFQLTELNNLLESLGKSRDASIKQFGLAIGNIDSPSRCQRTLQTLRNCLASHFSSGAAEMDRPFVIHAIKLLEWQIAADEKFRSLNSVQEVGENIIGAPALLSVAHACRYHWENPKSKNTVPDPLAPSVLCQSLGINQRAYQWTALRTKAQEQAWEAVDGLFISKGWFQGIRLIGGSNSIPMADVATELHALGAPEDIVVKYIKLVEGVEERISLANRLQCHTAAIDIMKSQGDRLGICRLKDRLPPRSEEQLYAENALKSSSIRWKN